ncbi:MAG: glutaredoxin family protein [Cytophaga sp.]|nr:glutaredoxin family protein [Undibacterium sp.]
MNIHSSFGTAFNKSFVFICLAILCLSSSNAHAQLYKWLGPDGKVTYSDLPPPQGAKQLETKAINSESAGILLPQELEAAVAQNPVTLYTAPSCTPCTEGRSLLKQLGIPFSEKTIKSPEDIDKLKQVSGDAQLPVLVINKNKLRGLGETEWRVALSNAGYPDTNKLPKEYRYPAPEPAAPPPPLKKEGDANSGLPKPKPSSEAGIRF